MDKYSEVVFKIVREQEMVVGPLAIDLARNVNGLKVNNRNEFSIEGDPKLALHELLMQYKKLFGELSLQVSKNALKDNIKNFQKGELPEILQN